MILQTMTPEEKVGQMEKLQPMIHEAANAWMKHNNRAVFRTKVFPSFYTFERTFEGMGKWTVIICAESKALLRKDIVAVQAYQTYTVSHSKKENNNGTGIYTFNAKGLTTVTCEEYPPHFFNQFRKRFVEARGLVQPDFKNLVKMVFREHNDALDETAKSFRLKLDDDDNMFLEETEEYNKKAGYDNLISYSRNGISLGIAAADRRYFNFTTFISNEKLKGNQPDDQKKNLKKLLKYRYDTDMNPFEEQEHSISFVPVSENDYRH